MDIDIDSEKLKNVFKRTNFRKVFFEYLGRWAKEIIFFVAVLGTAGCVYFWYIFICNPGWSATQKQQYLKTKEQGVAFDKVKFDALVATAKRRAADEAKAPANVPDIFRLKQLILPANANSSVPASSQNPPSTTSTNPSSTATPSTATPTPSTALPASSSGSVAASPAATSSTPTSAPASTTPPASVTPISNSSKNKK